MDRDNKRKNDNDEYLKEFTNQMEAIKQDLLASKLPQNIKTSISHDIDTAVQHAKADVESNAWTSAKRWALRFIGAQAIRELIDEIQNYL